MKPGAIELTRFKLRGYSLKEFIDSNKADIDKWLKRQEGFQSRCIIETEDGTVMDIVFWDKPDHGTAAMHRIMSATADSQVHSMIDQGTVSWNIYAVGHYVERSK